MFYDDAFIIANFIALARYFNGFLHRSSTLFVAASSTGV